MFEFHCWATVQSTAGGVEADGELLRALEARIATQRVKVQVIPDFEKE